jgi:hypothetical protein
MVRSSILVCGATYGNDIFDAHRDNGKRFRSQGSPVFMLDHLTTAQTSAGSPYGVVPATTLQDPLKHACFVCRST